MAIQFGHIDILKYIQTLIVFNKTLVLDTDCNSPLSLAIIHGQ